MYPQDDKEFYKNVTALKNMDYGNLYSGINPKYEFQTAYSVLYLQEIIHDEDSSILKHFYNDGYTDEKIDVLMDKANRIDDWITNKELERNINAEVFMDSFNSQMKELIEILKEIDGNFEK